MFIYFPVSLGFIIKVPYSSLINVKKQLIYAASFLESDDSGCVYHPKGFVLRKNPTPVVAAISNYQHEDFDFTKAAIEMLNLLQIQDVDTIKILICVSDEVLSNHNNKKICAKAKITDCSFIMYKPSGDFGKDVLKFYKDKYAAHKE